MPDINPEYTGAFTGAGDLFGLFSDKPAAKDLLKYLTTAEAQQIWVDRRRRLSANTKVTSYPDEVSKRSAEILTGAKIFRFDGGDLMPTAMNDAFFRAMVDYAEDPSTARPDPRQARRQVPAGAYAALTRSQPGSRPAGSPSDLWRRRRRWGNGSSPRRSSWWASRWSSIGYICHSSGCCDSCLRSAGPRIRPWLWIAPALAFLFVFLIYPTINTIVLSFMDKFSKNFVGLENYLWFFGDPRHPRGAPTACCGSCS